MKARLLSIIVIAGVWLAACAAADDTTQPPLIAYGEDVCENCKMIISEERFASAYWTADGVARRFDDIGGMVAYHQMHQETVATFWVHDLPSGAWIPAETATYVLDDAQQTPMGFGVAAYETEAQARAMAFGQSSARLLTWAELLATRLASIPNP